MADALSAAALAQLEVLHEEWKTARTGRTLHTALWEVAQAFAPQWLQEAFYPRWRRALDSDALTLDEAFCSEEFSDLPLWPKGTRRGSVREKRIASERAHAAVWQLVKADRSRPIDEGLFEEAGELLADDSGKALSARTVSRRYYAAVEAGALDLAIFKTATCQKLGETLTKTFVDPAGKVASNATD